MQKELNCMNRKFNNDIIRIGNLYANTKGIQIQIAGRIDETKLHMSSGSEKVGFLYKPLERKLSIAVIEFELSMGY
ncbi:hypothetical protein EPI10_025068 [Gossypium australe]|uniref:Uncharacterized protein n=1 Tax=Gossypium australe TaxID=47621 RepID=A0A5B6W125_9ROSI|nr:hypothetical protein EPI10_025068 [Gossypium australe]